MTTTTPTYCARGCTIRGQHLADCNGFAPNTVDPCRGCIPRPAEYGQLCAMDWQRLCGDVIDAARLVRHLRDDVADPDAAGGSAPATDGPRVYRDPAEGSVLSPAIGAADELHALLADIAAQIVDEHPARLTGPPEVGVWRSQQTLKHDPDTGDTYVVPSRVIGIRDATATEHLVAWLLPLLPWVAEHEWVVDVRHDLATLVRTTLARWPLEDRGRNVTAPCPTCGHLGMHYQPPTVPNATPVVTCRNPDCARTLTEDEWDTARELTEATTGRRL